jgi:hypothetical protein
MALTLGGCGLFKPNPPVYPKWPDAIQELKEKCPDLKTIEGNQIAVTELLKAVVHNYQLYYECSLKNDGWNKWYEEQKKIYEQATTKK